MNSFEIKSSTQSQVTNKQYMYSCTTDTTDAISSKEKLTIIIAFMIFTI
jgi:hypothetical protein